MFWTAQPCGCIHESVMGQKRPLKCDCGNLFQRPGKGLKRSPLTEVAAKQGRLKQGKGFAASPEQRKKVRGLPCVVCGQSEGFDIGEGGGVFKIDPAHVYPRRLAACECADGVVPLCSEHHRLFDDPNKSVDLLPALVGRGYHAELVHAVSVHGVPLVALLEKVTGQKWTPVEGVKCLP